MSGLVKPTVTFSTDAVESYSQPNASAPTAAGNPLLANSRDASRLTFQVAQSRFGLHFNEKGALRGLLEFDFIDFSKASPTVASLPRVRIAAFEWSPMAGLFIGAGQEWDLYAPLNPHTANLVGSNFQSGNAAFMRQQVKVLYRPGPFEVGAAAGLAAANAGAKDGNIELGSIPTGAVRFQWLPSTGNRLGLSAIATSLRFEGASGPERRLAGAVALFGELTMGRTNARLEASIGRNSANLGLLTIGTGYAGTDVDEVGGFVSVRQGLHAQHFVSARAGYARLIDAAKVRASYGYQTNSTVAVSMGTGAGIKSNLSTAAAYEFRPLKNLGFVFETTYFRTEHQLVSSDVDQMNATREAVVFDLSALVTF